MKKVISFCLYGSNIKYCQGLVENLKIINEKLPEFEAWIYISDDVPKKYTEQYNAYNNVKLLTINETGPLFRSYRFYPIDDENVELLFSRDADSRIEERDLWCMNEFINSNKTFHIIRDHHWHQARTEAGLFGIKCKLGIEKLHKKWIKNNVEQAKKDNGDCIFLKDCLYNKVKDNALIHTNILAYNGEITNRIEIEQKNVYDFVGNVYEYKNDEQYPFFKYDTIPYPSHFKFLYDECQYEIIKYIASDKEKIKDILLKHDPYTRNELLNIIFLSYFKLNLYEDCLWINEFYKYTHIDEQNIIQSNLLLNELKNNGYKIIGTTKPLREPNIDKKEIIICYGSYCLDVNNLISSTFKIFRHAYFYKLIEYDFFEGDECWDKIDRIYIMNLVERKDRFMEMLVELCHMNVPLTIIYHYKAQKENLANDKTLNSYLGATKNHLDVVNHMLQHNYEYCLFLEDDFTFNCNYNTHKHNLKVFLDRNYDFDVCLISSSKYYEIKPYDDLLSLSYQQCTTSSGYILQKRNAIKINQCFYEGFVKMKETGDYVKYVCDRYWAKLQNDNKFFVFNQKMGYQRANYSNINGTVICNYD